MKFNEENNISPQQIIKHRSSLLSHASGIIDRKQRVYVEPELNQPSIAADPVVASWGETELKKAIELARKNMEKASANLEFMEAASFRDEMRALEERLKEISKFEV